MNIMKRLEGCSVRGEGESEGGGRTGISLFQSVCRRERVRGEGESGIVCSSLIFSI